MDMAATDGVLGFLINEHSWYRFVTTADIVRAAIWCLSNLAIAGSYFLLPIEIRHWLLAFPRRSTTLIGTLFIAFIAFCGFSHLAMIVIMPTAPWWVVLAVYLPTGIVSLLTVIVVRKERRLIVAALQSVGAALSESGG